MKKKTLKFSFIEIMDPSKKAAYGRKYVQIIYQKGINIKI